MKYLPEPIIQAIPGTNQFRLHEGWQIDFKANGKKYVLKVKEGAVTDGASIPKFVWSIPVIGGHPLEGLVLPGAFAHDMLYAAEHLDRAVCDDIFRDLMIRNKVNFMKRNTYYYAVRTCGGAVWRKHTNHSIEDCRKFCDLEESLPLNKTVLKG